MILRRFPVQRLPCRIRQFGFRLVAMRGIRDEPLNRRLRSASLKVRIFDKFGIPVPETQQGPQTVEEIIALAPSPRLKQQVEKYTTQHLWSAPSLVQSFTIPLALQHYDVLCIAPPATGKTFAYAFSSMIRLAMKDMAQSSASSVMRISGQSVDDVIQQKIKSKQICQYCELDVFETKICPITGTLHPPPISSISEKKWNRRLEDLDTIAHPQVLVLAPSSTLVHQIFATYSNISNDLVVRYIVRASSAEEQKKYLQALEGVDILISTPETILPALLKRKLTFKKVKVLIIDEIDEIASNNHFDALKTILASMPKGRSRPQKLLWGASLPPTVYQMLKEDLLEPTHRFVLVERWKSESSNSVSEFDNVKQAVLLVGQAEKMQKVLALFQQKKISSERQTIIFCNSRHNVAYVADRLRASFPELNVTTLSAKASHTAKVSTLKLFRSGLSRCLVCTDLLSRGMDLPNVSYVVQYDLPVEMNTWMHRSGRCGRDGKEGVNYSCFQPENAKLAKPLVAFLKENNQFVPPKLQEIARQTFLDFYKNSLFYHPTRAYRRNDPHIRAPVLGRGLPQYPDYKQEKMNKERRPY